LAIEISQGIIATLALTLGGAGVKMAHEITRLKAKSKTWEENSEHLTDIRERVKAQEVNMDWVKDKLEKIHTHVATNGTLYHK
jgi:hypothetical protein